MLKPAEDFIQAKLRERKENNSFRFLKSNIGLVDFCSNDYLGFARSPELKLKVEEALKAFPGYLLGSTGSRLISGNSVFLETLEQEIAGFHEAETALIFNSGYDANLGLLSCLPQRGDTVVVDELIHASIIDGIKLSNANKFSFRHNDLYDLEKKLKAAKGRIFLAVESIYSMDGDEAPLHEISSIAKRYNAALIVDEAHAFGIFGEQGRGLVYEKGLQEKVFARIITFGKALGTHGAAVLGSKDLRNYLINFSRSFIYTTAASPHTHISIKTAYDFLKSGDKQTLIRDKISLFKKNLTGEKLAESNSPIQCYEVPGNNEAQITAAKLQEEGYDVRAILHPTVPTGKERLRICLHTFNTDEEVINLAKSLSNL